MHDEGDEYCSIIQGIYNNPLAPVDITVRQLMGLKAHVPLCESCIKLIDELHQRYPAKKNSGFYQSEPN